MQSPLLQANWDEGSQRAATARDLNIICEIFYFDFSTITLTRALLFVAAVRAVDDAVAAVTEADTGSVVTNKLRLGAARLY